MSFPYTVCVLNVHGCLNVGAIMRSAHLCGARKMIIFGRRKYDKRSAVGAMHYMTVERVEGMKHDLSKMGKEVLEKEDYDLNPDIFLEYMNSNNYLPVFVEQCEGSVMLNEENITNILRNEEELTPCFILGNEQYGVPQNILDLKPQFKRCVSVELQQMGALESFNVSACGSIVLYRVMECYSKFMDVPTTEARNDMKKRLAVEREKESSSPPE